MLDYEFMRNTVVSCAFMIIIMLDVYGIGYWIVKLVKWIIKKVRRKADVEPTEEQKTEAE